MNFGRYDSKKNSPHMQKGPATTAGPFSTLKNELTTFLFVLPKNQSNYQN